MQGYSARIIGLIGDSVRDRIEWNDEYSCQYIVGYDIVEDSYMTEFERSQLEYEGHIAYPAKVLELDSIRSN